MQLTAVANVLIGTLLLPLNFAQHLPFWQGVVAQTVHGLRGEGRKASPLNNRGGFRYCRLWGSRILTSYAPKFRLLSGYIIDFVDDYFCHLRFAILGDDIEIQIQ